MRISNASLAYPFDSSPALFPESTQPDYDHPRCSHQTGVQAPPAPCGSWHYKTKRGRKLASLSAAFFSLGVHALILFGFNTKPTARPKYVEPALALTLVKMPELPEEPDEEIPDLDKGSEIAEGVDVPRQADVPTTVILDNMMTQAFDPRSLQPNLNIAGTKLTSIPANVRIGGAGGKGIKEIFNLADLDRAPTPIFQPPPNIPPNLRQQGGDVNVVVEFVVNNKGEVVDARVLSSSDRRYDDIATTAVMKWRFKPGIKRGRSVAARIHQPFIITIASET